MSNDTRLDWRVCLPLGPRGWLWRTSGFSAAEVRRLLGEHPPGPRAQAVRRCVAHASDWFPPEDVVRCPWYYRRHLARIVFWSARGLSPKAISRRLGVRASAWGVERVLDEACRQIATCLNAAPEQYGL